MPGFPVDGLISEFHLIYLFLINSFINYLINEINSELCHPCLVVNYS